jgi:hypothetical protein
MIEITVKAGQGSDTIACLIATMLYDEGFDVVVDSFDGSAFADVALALADENKHKLRQNTTISVSVEQLEKE